MNKRFLFSNFAPVRGAARALCVVSDQRCKHADRLASMTTVYSKAEPHYAFLLKVLILALIYVLGEARCCICGRAQTHQAADWARGAAQQLLFVASTR